jgi:hypothetical protein
MDIKTLLAIGGAAAGGGGLGYLLGNRSEEENLSEQADTFNQYNQEEDEMIANEAFVKGVEYALSGAEGEEKQAFYKDFSEAAFKDELEKIAAPANVKKILSTVKSKSSSALKDIKTKQQAAQEILKNRGAQIGSAVGSGLGALRQSAVSVPKLIKHPSLKNFRKSGLALGTGAGVAGLAAGIIAANKD